MGVPFYRWAILKAVLIVTGKSRRLDCFPGRIARENYGIMCREGRTEYPVLLLDARPNQLNQRLLEAHPMREPRICPLYKSISRSIASAVATAAGGLRMAAPGNQPKPVS